LGGHRLDDARNQSEVVGTAHIASLVCGECRQRSPRNDEPGARLNAAPGSFNSSGRSEESMKRSTFAGSESVERDLNSEAQPGALPNRMMAAFEVAEFLGCHEETVRRAYLRGLLVSQRFGVRGRRFHPSDVLDWIKRGAPTRVS
jgi:excisionase family DNA binding protein